MSKLRSKDEYVYVEGYGIGQIHGTHGMPSTGLSQSVRFTETLSSGASIHKILTFP